IAMIIERVSGKPYAQFFHDELAAPAGLAHTLYDDGVALLPHAARNYQFLDGRLAHESGPLWSNAFAGGAMISTAFDLVQWNLALTHGRIITPASYEELTTPYRLADGSASRYALNWWIEEWKGHRVFWHSGHGGSCTAHLACFPDDAVTIAVLSNSS